MKIHKTKENMNKKLLPCPFCGGSAYFWKLYTDEFNVKISCINDCVTMPPRLDVSFTSIENAIKKWNKRYEK